MRWRIPVAIVDADPGDWEAWTEAMLAAAETAARGTRVTWILLAMRQIRIP